MHQPSCTLCGDAGRHADGSRVVFCTCAAGASAQEQHVRDLADATMADEARMPKGATNE